MKILLIGECYSANLGDGVICETVASLIKEKYHDAEITYFDLSGRSDFGQYHTRYLDTKSFTWLCRIGYRLPWLINWHPLFQEFKKDEIRYAVSLGYLNTVLKDRYDLAVFAGGSLFMDYFAGMLYCVTYELNKRKIPMIFHACGMSALNYNSTKLLRKTLSRKYVYSVSLRDSEETFQKKFPNIPYFSTYDTALNCNKFFERSSHLEADIGIGVIALKEYRDFQTELIRYFLQSNLSWKLFTNGADYQLAKTILIELGIDESNVGKYLLDRPLTPADLVKTVTSFSKIISFRMHSQIIASAYGIESFGFIWDNKVSEMYKRLGFENCCQSPHIESIFDGSIFKESMDQHKLICNAELAAEHSKNELYDKIDRIINC